MKYMTERMMNWMSNNGFTIIETATSPLGAEIITAKKETDRGSMQVDWCENGTARVLKPNGSVKWLYRKTDAQICRALLQTVEANTDRKYFLGVRDEV